MNQSKQTAEPKAAAKEGRGPVISMGTLDGSAGRVAQMQRALGNSYAGRFFGAQPPQANAAPATRAKPVCPPADPCKTCAHGAVKDIEVTKVDARVEGLKEKWKEQEGSSTSFSFSATAEVDGGGTPTFKWHFGDRTSSDDPNPTHVYEKRGRYLATLTVGCKDCPNVQKVFDMVSVVVAPFDFETLGVAGSTNRKRSTLAPGEEVWVSIPADEPEISINVVGSGKLSSPVRRNLNPFAVTDIIINFTAPAVAGPTTIRIQAPTLPPIERTFTVFPPTHVTMRRIKAVSGLSAGEVGAAMAIVPRVHSSDGSGIDPLVSFYNIEVSASALSLPENVRGYFARLLNLSDLNVASLPVGPASVAPGAVGITPAAGAITLLLHGTREPNELMLQPEFIELQGRSLRPPWAAGSFVCSRSWSYHIVGDPKEHEFAVTERFFALAGPEGFKDAATVTIEEGGACVSRTPDNHDYGCT